MLVEDAPKQSINEVFSILSNDGKKLLISMCHPAETGVTMEAIAAFSGIEKERLDSTMGELRGQGLLESGNLLEGKFVAGEGGRYRLPPKVKEQVLKDILKF